MNHLLTTEKFLINDIPCLRIRPIEKTPETTLIYYHGWHSSKEDVTDNAKILACFGYQIIIPDAIYHGERHPINYDEEGMLDLYFWKIIFHTIDESTPFIHTLIKDYQIDNLFVLGSSMGGFSASGVFVRNPCIKGLITMNGSCAYVYTETLFRKLENKPELNRDFKETLIKYDPSYHLNLIANRPILMLHGVDDQVIPIEIQRYFHQYYRNETNKLIEYKGINHRTTNTMFDDINLWLKNDMS